MQYEYSQESGELKQLTDTHPLHKYRHQTHPLHSYSHLTWCGDGQENGETSNR